MVEWVTGVITPAVTIAVAVVLGAWFIFLLYKIITWIFPNFKWILKYKVFKINYKDGDVEYCASAIDRNMNVTEFQKFLLIKGVKKKRVKELLYIYDEVRKLKGGDNLYGRQEITGKDKSALPKIKEEES